MKLKYSFENMELDDQVIAVPIGEDAQEFRGVIKLNESALEIFELLKEETTIDEVVDHLKKKYGDDSEIKCFVEDVVKYLVAEEVLE